MAKNKPARRGPRLQSIGWTADTWERRLHDGSVRRRTVLAEAEELAGRVAGQSIIEITSDEDPDKYTSAVRDGIEDNAAYTAKLLGRGIYAAVYGPADPLDRGPAWSQALAKAIRDTAGFSSLREATNYDPAITSLVTTKLLSEATELIPGIIESLWEKGQGPGEEPKKPSSDEECNGGNAPGSSGGQGDGAGSEGQGSGDGDGDSDQPSPGQQAVQQAADEVRQAMALAVREAHEEAEEAKTALNGLFPGLGSSPSRAQAEDPRREELARLLVGSDTMRRILKVAGRISRIAARVRKQQSEDARSEIVDIERGADLPRVLPSELAMFNDPDFGSLALARFAERSLTQYRLSGTEKIGRGPMVVMLDVSGSMEYGCGGGLTRIQWASAIGIALARSAIKQHRSIKVMTFDTRVHRVWDFGKMSRDDRINAILDLAALGTRGGTAFDHTICQALDEGAEKDKADLVIVTDGYGYVNDVTLARLDEAKSRGLRCWGIVAGEGEFDADTLGRVCNGSVVVGADDVDGRKAEKALGELGI